MENVELKSQEILISVLMPVYNGSDFLNEAIDSILNQTYSNFELIIIDDGSNDKSIDIIRSYKDQRIKLYQNENNKGLIYTLNKGLSLANGKYIARMDADDICLPNRLEVQINFLESNPEIAILGGSFIYLNTNFEKHFPLSDEKIRVLLLERTSFAHPCVVLRKSAIEEKKLSYDERYNFAEDYHLWTMASITNLKMANLDDVLIYYRQHTNQISSAKFEQQKEITDKIRLEYWSYFFEKYLDKEEISLIISIEKRYSLSKLLLFEKITKINALHHIFDIKLFNRYILDLLYKCFDRENILKFTFLVKCLSKISSKEINSTLTKIYIKQKLNLI